MKHLILVAFIAFVTTAAYTQDIPAKANTITVTLADSNKVNEKVLKLLTDKGYSVSQKTSPFTSTPKSLKNNARLILTANVKGADVIFTGKVLLAGQGTLPVEYKGNKGTPNMTSWEEMDKLAKSLGGKVKYEVK